MCYVVDALCHDYWALSVPILVRVYSPSFSSTRRLAAIQATLSVQYSIVFGTASLADVNVSSTTGWIQIPAQSSTAYVFRASLLKLRMVSCVLDITVLYRSHLCSLVRSHMRSSRREGTSPSRSSTIISVRATRHSPSSSSACCHRRTLASHTLLVGSAQ